MASLIGTAEVVREAKRFATANSFFGRFENAWDSASRSVRKIETRQEYREPGNPSWEKLAAGDLAEALRLVPESREVDAPLYEDLERRGVTFTRCRPVTLPLTPYLRWEIASYDFNAARGEVILFAGTDDVAQVLQTSIRHDFMVFDTALALIHDYDASGEIRGGWETTQPEAVSVLAELFDDFRLQCIPYREYLKTQADAL